MGILGAVLLFAAKKGFLHLPSKFGRFGGPKGLDARISYMQQQRHHLVSWECPPPDWLDERPGTPNSTLCPWRKPGQEATEEPQGPACYGHLPGSTVQGVRSRRGQSTYASYGNDGILCSSAGFA